jgi:carboxymethylenebutenolidase
MIEKFVDIPTAAGSMDAFVTYPEAPQRYPAVLILMDIWGLREELFDVARRIATCGYYCILPNTYYRQGKVRFEYRNDKGQMKSIETLPHDVQESLRDHMRALTDAMVVEDSRFILDFLADEPAHTGTVGILGYCMGGRHALAVAGNCPAQFRATASLHGTRLVTPGPDSVHRLAENFRGEIYCGFAEHDSLAPPATIEALATALKDQPGLRYDYEVHAGTDHGYSLPDRDIFHKRAANRDWELIFSMFRRMLPAPSGGRS